MKKCSIIYTICSDGRLGLTTESNSSPFSFLKQGLTISPGELCRSGWTGTRRSACPFPVRLAVPSIVLSLWWERKNGAWGLLPDFLQGDALKTGGGDVIKEGYHFGFFCWQADWTFLHKSYSVEGWREGLVVRSTQCLCRDRGFVPSTH